MLKWESSLKAKIRQHDNQLKHTAGVQGQKEQEVLKPTRISHHGVSSSVKRARCYSRCLEEIDPPVRSPQVEHVGPLAVV